jgi:uncharacterized membrane protein YeaQ/YmgE (transglycosylase-associated protein family)
MWAIISWIFFGLVVGVIAKIFVRGDHGFAGCLPTIVLGVIGSIVGGYIGKLLGIYDGVEFHPGGIFMSTLGAIIVLMIYRAAIKQRGP